MMSLCRFCCCFVFMSTSLTIGLFLRLTMCDWEWIMGSKNVCTVVCVCVCVCVCVHNLLAAYTVLYAYLHCIHLCVGQWVCVCDCMYVTAGVRERERERSHWYCAVTLLHYHDYVFTLLCIECFICDSWYRWWDNFPSSFFPFHFRGCCMHTKGHWNLHRYGKEKHIISITDSNPGFLAFFF